MRGALDQLRKDAHLEPVITGLVKKFKTEDALAVLLVSRVQEDLFTVT